MSTSHLLKDRNTQKQPACKVAVVHRRSDFPRYAAPDSPYNWSWEVFFQKESIHNLKTSLAQHCLLSTFGKSVKPTVNGITLL